MENAFLRDIDQIIIKNLDDEKLGVSEIAEQLSLSRFQLQRRFKKLTGNSVNQHIRELRLKKALEFLQENNQQIAEIAYKVGFSSPSYFTKCFQEYFGILPSEVHRRVFVEGESILPSSETQTISDSNSNKTGIKHFLFDANWKLYVHSAIFLIIIVSVVLFMYPLFERKAPLLGGQNSILFLPVKIEGASIEDSVYQILNWELRQYLEENTELSTIYYSFDRDKIDSEEQIQRLGLDLKTNYVADLMFDINSSDSIAYLKIYSLGKDRNHFTWSFTNNFSSLKENCYQALNEFIYHEEIASRSIIDQGESNSNNIVINEKFQVAKLYYNLFQNTFFSEDLRIAKKMALEALTQDPDNREVLFLLGRIYSDIHIILDDYSRIGQYYDSINIISERILELNSQDASAYELKALYAGLNDNWEEANNHYKKALALDSGSVLSYVQIARNHMAANNPATAIKYWEQVEKYDTSNYMQTWTILSKAITFTAMGDTPTADSLFKSLLALTPENIINHSISLWHDIAQGRYEEVRKKVDQYCQGDPLCRLGHFYIESYLAEGKYEEALPYLENSFRGFGWNNNRNYRDQPCDQCDRLVAYILWKTGKKGEANKILLPYIERLNKQLLNTGIFERANTTWDLALTYAVMEDFEKSLEYLYKLEEISSYYPNFEWTKKHAVFQPLHEFPRYQQLINKIDKGRLQQRILLYGDSSINRIHF